MPLKRSALIDHRAAFELSHAHSAKRTHQHDTHRPHFVDDGFQQVARGDYRVQKHLCRRALESCRCVNHHLALCDSSPDLPQVPQIGRNKLELRLGITRCNLLESARLRCIAQHTTHIRLVMCEKPLHDRFTEKSACA